MPLLKVNDVVATLVKTGSEITALFKGLDSIVIESISSSIPEILILEFPDK